MVFNVVVRKHYDHTKNHSFLMDQSGVWHRLMICVTHIHHRVNGRVDINCR
ncbi:MAG: hypothetical protein PHP34_03215 [Bacteroidales bacterium]|nr:hypothetical protein [Bacteroidales bacterium]